MKDPNEELTENEMRELAQHLGNLASAAMFFRDRKDELNLGYEEKEMFYSLSDWVEEEMAKFEITDEGIEYEDEY